MGNLEANRGIVSVIGKKVTLFPQLLGKYTKAKAIILQSNSYNSSFFFMFHTLFLVSSLTDPPMSLSIFTSLSRLSITRNELTLIPPTIFTIKSLEYLDLSFNKIREIDLNKLSVFFLLVFIPIRPSVGSIPHDYNSFIKQD